MSPYRIFQTVRSQESAGLVVNTCFIGVQWKFVANVLLLHSILITCCYKLELFLWIGLFIKLFIFHIFLMHRCPI